MLEWCLLIEHRVELKWLLRKFIKIQSSTLCKNWGKIVKLVKIPNFRGGQELNWPQWHQIGRQWGQISSEEKNNLIGGQLENPCL
jgi:hypothetical protein